MLNAQPPAAVIPFEEDSFAESKPAPKLMPLPRCHRFLWQFLCRLAVVLLLCLVSVSPSQAAQALVLGIHPYLSGTEIYTRFSPLARYLGQQCNASVTITVSRNYAAHIEAVGKGMVDLAFMGPASYVEMTREYGPRPLLATFKTSGTRTFRGVIVVRKESSITALAQLKGKTFAFGPPSSTTSSLVPRYLLLKAGVALDELGQTRVMTNHENIAIGVLAGAFEAGAVKDELFVQFEAQGLRAVAASEPLPDHIFVARQGLKAEVADKLRAALLSLRDSEQGRQILAGMEQGLMALAPVTDSDYDPLRAILRYLADHGAMP